MDFQLRKQEKNYLELFLMKIVDCIVLKLIDWIIVVATSATQRIEFNRLGKSWNETKKSS